MSNPLRILWIATKTPLPAVDGGRLLVVETLRALRDAGHAVTLVAPFPLGEPPSTELAGLCTPRLVPDPPRPAALDYLRARLRRSPYTLERHRRPRLRAEVERLLRSETFELVHVEQLHALAQAEPAWTAAAPRPVVLRQQNVESDLWAALAGRGGLRGPLLGREAAALRRAEGVAVRRAAATVALTERDAARLRELGAGGGEVSCVRAPFPAMLAAGETALPGAPALVLFGSDGWWPNRDQQRWFLDEVWPRVRARTPGARLHVFGGAGTAPGATFHPAPRESRAVFAPGAALVVPVRIASGVRMKILEAWARGLPVVATPEAIAGLDGRDGEAFLLAPGGEEFARAAARLAAEPELARRLAAGGQRVLRERHAPRAIAAALEAVYRAALAGARR